MPGACIDHPEPPPPAELSLSPEPAEPNAGQVCRQVTDFLVLLIAGIMLLRFFVAEAYVVPTGSMAPTILGMHREFDCPNCRQRFAVGVDEAGQLAGQTVCPNCGNGEFGSTPGVDASGDRLLVQKFLYDFRAPRRWEAAVFQSPIEPEQAYVKRVVGLPGESVQIVAGDVWINGAIARKTLGETRATRIPVFDNRFQPQDAARFPRWIFDGDRSKRFTTTGWRTIGTTFVHEPTAASDAGDDWLTYRHWDPDRADFGPIRDSYAYNGGSHHAGNVVRDLTVAGSILVREDVDSVELRLVHGIDRFVVAIPVNGRGTVGVTRNNELLDVALGHPGLRSSPVDSPEWHDFELAVVDQRISATLDGERLFEPIDYELTGSPVLTTPTPFALGVVNGTVEVKDVRIYRDIYYTGELAAAVRRPAAVDAPFLLGDDEFFVLGDNSPVSNDSRFWADRPVVRRSRLLGKPFLVHLPGQAYGVKLFGHELGWIPDFREIRYIR